MTILGAGMRIAIIAALAVFTPSATTAGRGAEKAATRIQGRFTNRLSTIAATSIPPDR